MKTEFTIPDFTYFPILASATNAKPGPDGKPRPMLFLIPENYLPDCGKLQAIGWIEEYGDQLTAIYCYESGKLFDASSDIAKEWLKQETEGIMSASLEPDSYDFPAFIQNHAGKELDELITRWNHELREAIEYRSEVAFQFNTSRL